MNETRKRISEHVRSNPGVHFSGIVRDLDIATGQAQYHLRRLDRGGDITEESLFGRTHYYQPTYDEWERQALALLRRETSREMIAMALREGAVLATEAADELDIARSTVSWHLSNLESAGVVETHYAENGRLAFEVVEPDRTRELLGTVSPTLYEQLVDRFDRLVDQALEGSD
jgi:predicted transcriptional regulator